jgi:hypothetical protein
MPVRYRTQENVPETPARGIIARPFSRKCDARRSFEGYARIVLATLPLFFGAEIMSAGLTVCVYCGSRLGRRPVFREAAAAIGRGLAQRDITLVYGGGRVGTMAVMADAALAAGGRVIGVIPHHLERKEVGHRGVAELFIVDTM